MYTDEWISLGVHTTDSKGRLSFPITHKDLPRDPLAPNDLWGHYRLRMVHSKQKANPLLLSPTPLSPGLSARFSTQVVQHDNSMSGGQLFVLRRGVQAIVVDLDGTITVGDTQVVTQVHITFPLPPIQ